MISVGRTLEKLGPALYSPECVEEDFCELRHNGVLRSSFSHLTQSLQEVVHLGDAPSRLLMLVCLQWGCATISQSAPSRSREEQRQEDPVTTETPIRPFRIDVPEEDLVDLRRRIADTQWPEKETVADQSQGVPLAMIQELARYWATDYDWRKCEAKLNALPQFITEIDGLDIHFIHVRSNHENALPLIVTHGWPGSIIEQLKIIEPLTDPTAHGGSAEDAFDVVIPSMPGYGFSGKPTSTGWGPERMTRAWAQLMKRLGYSRYVAQGGDWGAFVVDQMGLQAPEGLLAIHTNMP